MLKFDLQLFGGGKKSKVKSVDAKIPTATDEEKQLLTQQLAFLNQAQPIASNLLTLGNNGVSQSYFTPDYQNLYNQAQAATTNNQNTVSGIQNQVQPAVNTANDANTGYINSLGNASSQYQEGNKYLDSAYVKAMQDNASNMSGLLNGVLPSTYAENRQKALQSDLTNTVGNTLSGLASRGIINSSVANSALNDISKNASNTLASRYTSDMNTAAGLANNAYNNQLNGLNGRASLLGDLYNTQASNIGQQAGLTASNLGNTMNGISTQSGLTNQAQDLATAPISTATSAQAGAVQTPLSLE